MRRIWMPSIVIAITLAAGSAAAQAPPPPAPGGAFESLSPGNQKIAQSIFEAQQPSGPGGPNKFLSLDEIATMKQGGTSGSGKGWGVTWQRMRSEGRVQGTMGGAVSQYNHAHKGSISPVTEITTGSGKTVTVGGNNRSNGPVSGRQGGSADSSSSASDTAGAANHGRDGGVGASATHGATTHGAGRGR